MDTKAKIYQLYIFEPVDQNIFSLYISMNNILIM